MGAWGTGSFENDSGMDWVYELEEAEDVEQFLTEVFDGILDRSGDDHDEDEDDQDEADGSDDDEDNDDEDDEEDDSYIDVDEGAAALAAAEFVAACRGKPSPDFPADELAELAAANKPLGQRLAKKALQVVAVIETTGEVRALWEETSENLDEWLKVTAGLKARLS